MALQVGDVNYGNEGITKRLDFIAIGPAVGLAVRVGGLTRALEAPLLATADFAARVAEPGISHPDQDSHSFDGPVRLLGNAVKV